MPSVHKVKSSRYWHCSYYLPDGRRTLRSTGTTNKAKAMEVGLKLARASQMGREGRLTEARAREAIAEIYAIANRENMPSATVKEYLDQWMQRKRLEVAETSILEYASAVKSFLAFLDQKGSKHMDSVTIREIAAYRDTLAKRVSGGTVNKTLKILRGAWAQALKDGIVRENAFTRIDFVKSDKTERRGFTLDEVKTALEASSAEWRGMILVGFYTGQRLGDIASLQWRSIDLEKEEICFITRKTKRPMHIPTPKPLQRYLLSLSVPDDPDTSLFPVSAIKGVNTLSREFAELLASVGLREKRDHEDRGIGRNHRRDTSGLSFHCLRHTTTSALKNAGVSNAIAMELIGHTSEAISKAYTHIEPAALRKAMNRLPNVL